jgi:hypothetical protein
MRHRHVRQVPLRQELGRLMPAASALCSTLVASSPVQDNVDGKNWIMKGACDMAPF